MNDQTDSQLLRAYAEKRSEAAFSELVRRHVDLVYSAALRMVCDSHLAQDVTQGAFIALAKNAAQLADRPVLSGWLHRTAQNIAARTVRTDVRRRAREQEATIMNQISSTEPDATWEEIAPHLDAALRDLSEAERDALLLRYFEKKSAREMAQILGTSEDAAQKRVSRAVERLRELVSKRGVTIGASGLVVAISANAVHAAPVGFALTVSTGAAAFTTTTIATTSTAALTTTKAITMTALQKTLVTATITILAGAGIFEAHQGAQLRDEIKQLQQQRVPLAEQIQQLQKERDDSIRQLASVRDAKANAGNNSNELLRLRNEVAQLRAQSANAKPLTNQRPPPGAKIVAKNSDARYIPKEDLANVGYATPLTALQTITWTLMKGSYDQANQGLGPELLESELKSPTNREEFEKRQSQMASLFKGIQIVAQKNISADKVELKVKYDSDPIPNAQSQHPEFLIQPLVKVGEEWKLGGSTRSYNPQWEQDGNVFQYTP